jgi:ABC-type sugar transport system ATPase subunit
MTSGLTVFLVDVDNTLLDNDRIQADLKRHLENEFGVDWAFTDFDLSLKVDKFEERYLAPYGSRLAAELDLRIAQRLYKQVFNFVGTPGTSPATADAGLAAMEKMDNWACPRGDIRRFAITPKANRTLLNGLSGFFNSLGLWPHHRPTPAHERRARELLRFLDISHLASRPLSAMSSGEQRRAMIGRALVHDPEALILDEPTTSLDPGAVREFRTVLRKLARAGKSLILVTHHIADLIPEIERVIMMKDGRIVADGPKAKLLTSPALSKLFGAKLQVMKRGKHYDVVSA